MAGGGSEGGNSTLASLISELGERISTWPGEDVFASDASFNEMAMEIHQAQARAYPWLATFWSARAAEEPDHWTRIPPVPTAAFKSLPFGPPHGAEAVFRTSGTSGTGARGELRVASLSLYREAARENYRRSLLRPGKRVRVLSLVPSPASAPDSSLGRMVSFLTEEPEVASSTWAFHPDDGLDLDLARKCLSASDGPVLLVSTAFALTLLLDGLREGAVPLPTGSGLMETGGFKGRVVGVGRGELYGRVGETLDVGEEWVVGEYGMTELMSQSYDGVLGMAAPLSEREHRFPPWVRTRVLDPASLQVLPPGEPGLLCHFDLAGAGSVCHVLTEDVGVGTPAGGFRLLGRAEGAEARGCSLMAESFLRAVGSSGR